jgi:hypothetical protein
MNSNPSPLTDDGTLDFDDLQDDDERWEYAQYIVNTPEEERPEISKEDAEAALEWLRYS